MAGRMPMLPAGVQIFASANRLVRRFDLLPVRPYDLNWMAESRPRAEHLAVAADADAAHKDGHRRRWRQRRDWGGLVARLSCGVFAIIGLLPLAAGMLVRLDAVQRWAADRTSQLLHDELGVDATYRVRVVPWPLSIALEDIDVASTDPDVPFLSARRVVARPRPFSLLAGKMSLGEVLVEELRVTAVVRDGELQNLRYRLPESSEDDDGESELPFQSLGLTNAALDLTVDDVRARVSEIDMDLGNDQGAIEVAMRFSTTLIDRKSVRPGREGEDQVDEDLICSLSLRARVQDEELTVRRLLVSGALDFDPDVDTRPRCDLSPDDWRHVELRLESTVLRLGKAGEDGARPFERVDGEVELRAPVPLVHRFLDLPPTTGWVGLHVTGGFRAGDELPALEGSFHGAALGIDGRVVAHFVQGDVAIERGVVRAKKLYFGWAGGEGRVAEASVWPLVEGIPLDAHDILIDGVRLEHLLSDLNVHPNAHVVWGIDQARVPRFGGNLSPVALTGLMHVDTSNFAVFDRPFTEVRDARRDNAMLRVPGGVLRGTFRVTEQGIVLQEYNVRTAKGSDLNTTVILGFQNEFGVRVFPGSRLDLGDVSPLVGLDLAGEATLDLHGHGTLSSPAIGGELAIADFDFDGYPLGDLVESKVKFVPLSVEVTAGKLVHRTVGPARARQPEAGADPAEPAVVAAATTTPRVLDDKKPSEIFIERLLVDFDAGADVTIEGRAHTFGRGLDVRHFLQMSRFDESPSFADFHGTARGTADVSFTLGGAQDRCGGGRLAVRTQMDLRAVEHRQGTPGAASPQPLVVFGETFDEGDIDLDFLWDDAAAGDRGLAADIYSATFRKGGGTLLARASIGHGGTLRADVIGDDVPLSAFDAYRKAFEVQPGAGQLATGGGAGAKQSPASAPKPSSRVEPEATVTVVAAVEGTLDRFAADASIDISPLRLGPTMLPASRLRLRMTPRGPAATVTGQTRCRHDIVTMPSVRAQLQRDLEEMQWAGPERRVARRVHDSELSLSGQLFDGQVVFDDVRVTQGSTHELLSGPQGARYLVESFRALSSCRGSGCKVEGVRFEQLDLGALANLVPGIAFSASPPTGALTAVLHVEELPIDNPARAEMSLTIDALELERSGDRLTIGRVEEAVLLRGTLLELQRLPLQIRLASGLRAELIAQGTLTDLTTDPSLDIRVQLPDVDLARLGVEVPQVERAAGTVRADIVLRGPVLSPRTSGELRIDNGALRVAGIPVTFDDIDVDVRIDEGEIRVRRAVARAGATGFVSLTARAPLDGLTIEQATGVLTVRNVKVPVADGINLTADANLDVSYQPGAATHLGALPTLTGQVTLSSFAYTRPMSLFTEDVQALTSRAPTVVETYDPREDTVAFDVTLRSPRPLRLVNNLVDLRLVVVEPGLRVVGTDQRFGAVGELQLQQGSKVFLQGHDFLVDEGRVEFEDTSRIAPKLDVHATTVFRRYASAAQSDASTASADPGAGTASTAGSWRIGLTASGDMETPQVRFSSDPPLSQDDIVLLLQIGMTRAELQRGLVGTLVQSVGLQALSEVTGLGKAVGNTVPIIDEVRIGSQYSSRTGRPEPSVSLGKRVTDDVRATVTTGLSENREVRSNLEWGLGEGLSVSASYDNVNDVSSSAFGNIGVGLRWRLEFE